ncbi:MAG: trehalose-phosphatase [Candidatus Levybacteria bacterium]|nr:trehalose-phosphatase [Candidatus Levybacteria bacterium]
MLDFDGTLTPIVKSPQAAKLSIEMKNLLRKLSQKQGLYLAIISGRSLEDLKKKVNLDNIIYSGNHGLEGEILKEEYCFPIPDKTLLALKIIRKQLNQIADQYKGVFIEDKRLVLSFHYRMAGKKISEVKSAFQKIVQPYVQDRLISVLAGKMVFSVRPKTDWNKGSFAKLVIDKIRGRIKIPPVAIFIGDDTTDEDIFRELKSGITVKVGKSVQSKAKYRLENTDDVFKFLEWIGAISC